MSDDYKVEHSSRDVIMNKLLTSLEEDDSAVAALMSMEDLDALIDALRGTEQPRNQSLYAGLCQLRVAAFGERK